MIKIKMETKFIPNKSAKVDLTCPECKRSGKYLLTKLQKDRSFKCIGCGKTIDVTGDGLEAIKRVTDQLKKLG